MPEQLATHLPLAALVAGALVLAWGQRDSLAGLLTQLRPAPAPAPQASPAERLEKFLALRDWCEQAGHTEAVQALDSTVLPALVRRATP